MHDAALALFGTEAPQPTSQTLRAGPLSVVLEEGQLRRICWQGQEAIRAISFLVRNTSWGTYAAKIDELSIQAGEESFLVRYRGQCADDKQALSYTVAISGHSDGTLAFEAELVPETNFATNRAGFVVLHPLNGVAGEPVVVTHTNGEIEHTLFPKHVVAEQPIFDIRSVEHQVRSGVRCLCTMEGDAFEMEDQRNWSDASFKTYIRPLAKGFPYTLSRGKVSQQAVRLQFIETQALPTLESEAAAPHVVTIESGTSGRLPELGLAVEADAPTPAGEALNAIAALAPQWLVGRVELTTPVDSLVNLARLAAATEARVCLEVVVSCEGPVASELARVAEMIAQSQLPLHAVVVSPAALARSVPANFKVPGLASLEELYAAARAAFPSARLGGGSLAYFTELNRNPPPSAAIDFITHTTCPIIHAADDHSVMESLQSLPWVFESALKLAGHSAYWIGPTSIGMRFNPYGASPASNPENQRVAMAQVDPRQRGIFGAAFYTAYAAIAARAGIATVTLAACTGAHGVVYTPGPEAKPGFDDRGRGVYPAFHALRWLAEAAKRPRVAVSVGGDGSVEALAYANKSGGKTLLLANTSAQAQRVTIAGRPQCTWLALDASSFAAATKDAGWSQTEGETTGDTFTLLPYAVARVRVA